MMSLISLPRWYAWFAAGAGFLGFLDAAYLTVKHFRGEAAPCSLVLGCEKVLSSSYATFGMMPLALWGVVYYLIIFFLAVAYVDSENAFVGTVLLASPVAGFLVSLALVYIQAFVLRSFCLYCLFSALISTLLFTAGLFVLKKALRYK